MRILALVLALLVVPRVVHADNTDKSLSPFFFVEGAAPGVEALPLESTKADVHISGVIADVTVKQMYRNDGEKTISAKYVFPASTRAAVYGMKMTIGDRVIVAKIKERQEARKEYEEAKAAGKTASLLEEDRPNVFSMNVANILPKDRIEVELKYTELLVPTDGVYELDYPTVVGPRYASDNLDAKNPTNQFVASPYTKSGAQPSYAFDINVSVAAGMKIQSIDSPSHTIKTSMGSAGTSANIALVNGSATGNKDFVLRYRLAGDDITPGLLLFPGQKENFFLMMVQPPHRPALEMIPAREYVFIIDVSGSMNGFPLDTTKTLMRDLLGKLRPTDHFNVLLFSGGSSLYSEKSVPAEKDKIADAISFIDREQGGGGTELLPAMQRAMKLPRLSKDLSRSFVVVTDGYIGEEAEMFEHIRAHLGEANVFSFGIGSSVNRHLVDGVAQAGQGEPFVILDPKQAPDAAKKFREYVESPVLTNVEVKFDGFNAYDLSSKSIPDVFANRPVVVFGKYKGTASGKITLTGVSGRGRFVATVEPAKFSADASNQALSYLWARNKVSELSDFTFGDENKEAVTKLGLDYNLLTKYTSFIAVQQIVRTTAGSTDVTQPLPMPEGVSDLAVAESGNEVGAEPGLIILLVLVGAVLILTQRRAARGVK
ncbi:MAG TPA: VIT domain-containing protein [Kofleriaceae bacterium]|nr:VIT domain-containing protein [Kofleriaceae bacterium]